MHNLEYKIYDLHLFFILLDKFLFPLFVGEQLREDLNKLVYFIEHGQAVLIGQLGECY